MCYWWQFWCHIPKPVQPPCYEVPEFSTIGAGLVLLSIGIYLYFRRKR